MTGGLQACCRPRYSAVARVWSRRASSTVAGPSNGNRGLQARSKSQPSHQDPSSRPPIDPRLPGPPGLHLQQRRPPSQQAASRGAGQQEHSQRRQTARPATLFPPPPLQPPGLSPRVLKASAKANIGFPGELRQIGRQSASSHYVKVRGTSRHTWHPYVMKYLVIHETPFLGQIIGKALAMSDQPLWYWATPIIENNSGATKSIVIKTAARKAMKAFRMALRAAGYDEVGRRLSGHVRSQGDGKGVGTDAPENKRSSTPKAELYGSVRLAFNALPMVQAPFAEVVDNLTKIVTRDLEPALGRRGPYHVKQWVHERRKNATDQGLRRPLDVYDTTNAQ